MPLNLDFSQRGQILHVQLTGSLRSQESETFAERMDEAIEAGQSAMIDLSRLEALDSRGLSELIQIVTRARLRDSRVVLLKPNAFVSGLLNVTRLDQWFEIFADECEAEKALVSA